MAVEVTSLTCLCSVQYHYPSPLLGLQCFVFLHLLRCFIVPFLISGVERLSRFQCLKSLEKAVLLVRLGSASQWQWGGYSLATNQKYPCGKLINVPLLGGVEKRDHGIASWVFPGNLFFFFLRQSVCLIIQQCLHEEDAEKCMTCKQLGSQVWYVHIYLATHEHNLFEVFTK